MKRFDTPGRCLGMLLLWSVSALAGPEDLRDGDLVFQTSRSAQSLAIQLATDSPCSHMGVVLFRGWRPFVFEAVATVRYTPLRAWIDRGQGRRFVAKRLRNAPDADRLRKAARAFEGRPYDPAFEWSDRRIYCSELVWKLYKKALDIEIGPLQRLKEFRLEDPRVRSKLRERYGAELPLEEPVISPAALFESPLLEAVPGS